MKRLIEYIIENNIENLRSSIINSINNIEDEKTLDTVNSVANTKNKALLNKIYKQVSVTDDDFGTYSNNIKTFLNSRNIKGSVCKNIIQKIKYYVSSKEIDQVIQSFNKKSSDIKYINSVDLLTHDLTPHNIFDQIEEFVTSIKNFNYDDEFRDFCKDLSNYSLGDKVAIGKYEYLLKLFINDYINDSNIKGDVTTSKGGFEVKAPGGRLQGNKTDTKLKDASILTETCTNMTLNILDDILGNTYKPSDSQKYRNKYYVLGLQSYKDINNNFDNYDVDDDTNDAINNLVGLNNIFGNNANITKYIDIFLQIFKNVDDETLNKIFKEIIITTFMSQLYNTNLDSKDNKTIYDKLINSDHLNFNLKNKDKKVVNYKECSEKIENIWLFLGLLHYRLTEGFNYLIVFDNDGYYMTVNLSNEKELLDTIYNIIFSDKPIIKCCYNVFPTKTKGSNDQNNAPAIELTKIQN